jgi:dTDP-4-amino-4,6-dideoxygalactose transaminase
MKDSISRRHFLETASLAGAGLSLALPQLARGHGTASAAEVSAGKPAKLGGKAVCSGGWPGWPVCDETEEKALLSTLHSGQWYRGSGKAVSSFEDAYKKVTGAKHCLATASGTAALYTALGALDVGPGDEVIIPPYTFVATYNVVVLNYALPVFVDSDLESFQIDANKIEAAITKDTKAIMPVHLGGYPADLDKVLEVAGKHKIPVIEDACQAHLAEWRGRKVGTWGLAGCFSFQASKNLNSGEGGAVLTNDDQFAEVCYNFHNQGRARQVTGYNFTYSGTRGSNLRLCEFQGSLLEAQMTRVVEQSNRRNENALYLTKLLGEIPGIKPAKLYDGATRSAYHLYMFRYDPAQFAGLDRAKFLAALGAEGVPASGGYGVMNKDAYVSGLAKNKHFLKLYGEKKLKHWLERNHALPQNDKLCAGAVWFTQTMLLAERTRMDQIAEAIRKIQQHAAELARA